MLKLIKNAFIGVMLATSLAACTAPTPMSGSMSGMKMNHTMCQKMMKDQACGCCKMMQSGMMQNQDNTRTAGMMSDGGMKMMQCKPMNMDKTAKVTKKKTSHKTKKSVMTKTIVKTEKAVITDTADHTAHHPAETK
jgi:hypothetical protein